MAADPGNYPGVGSPGQGVRWEGRSSVPEGLRLWAPCVPKFRNRVPFFGKKKATLLFQFPAVFWCVITGLV